MLSLLAVLLTTTLALGCADSALTAPEQHPGLEAFGPTAASKGKPDEAGIVRRATFPGSQVCGIPVTVDVFEAGTEEDLVVPGVSKQTGLARVVFTATNGQVIQLQGAGQFTEVTEWINEAEGIFWSTRTWKGTYQSLRIPNGPVLSHDHGRLVLGFLRQLQDDNSAIFLGPPEILEVSGPHPEAESNFTLFCEIVTDALT